MGFSQQHAWSPVIRSNGPMDSARPRNTGEEMAEEVWASTGVMAVKLLPGVKRDPLRLPHPGKHWLYMWVGRGPTYPPHLLPHLALPMMRLVQSLTAVPRRSQVLTMGSDAPRSVSMGSVGRSMSPARLRRKYRAPRNVTHLFTSLPPPPTGTHRRGKSVLLCPWPSVSPDRIPQEDCFPSHLLSSAHCPRMGKPFTLGGTARVV